jgi:hypothetical protein
VRVGRWVGLLVRPGFTPGVLGACVGSVVGRPGVVGTGVGVAVGSTVGVAVGGCGVTAIVADGVGVADGDRLSLGVGLTVPGPTVPLGPSGTERSSTWGCRDSGRTASGTGMNGVSRLGPPTIVLTSRQT